MKNKILTALFVLFHPSYWIMINKYNKELDELLIHLMDNYNFHKTGKYTAKIGPHEFWTSNQPYCCFYPYIFTRGNSGIRPSILTIKRAIDKLNKDTQTEGLK